MTKNAKTENVLVVEDDIATLEAIIFKLKQAGIGTDAALNGEEALKKVKDNDYRLVLLDLLMPKKSGFDFLRETQTNPRFKTGKTKILIFTNLTQEYSGPANDLGATLYIVKASTSINKLVEIVKDELAK